MSFAPLSASARIERHCASYDSEWSLVELAFQIGNVWGIYPAR